MPVVCPACGQENPDVARFCLACGTPLEAPAPAAEERKLVSVLFCDLVGHTAASDRADPEDVRARLRPYHELVRREIERYGGTLEKFVGDAVMAVFGAPVAHEDDAERGVRCGLRILEAVEELRVQVRAAITTGEAVVSLQARPQEGEGIVAGDVVNTASRLQQAAPPGTLVVGEATWRATRDAIEYEGLDPVRVKGKEDPVAIWRAVRARGRFGVDADAPRTPFVGREHDLVLLRNTYERALRESAIQLVTVIGEPGVGKTRLLAELRSWLDDRPELVRWRQGRSLPYGEGITYWALGEIVKAEAGVLETDGSARAAAKLRHALEAVVEEGSERQWLEARLAPLVGAAAGASEAVGQEEAFTAWRRFLEALAAQRPLVLVLEDLHWADAPLLEFFDHVVDWASGVPMLVLCTARPELYERHPGWGGGKRNSNTISLSPLTGDETTRLLSALLSRAVLPAATQTELLDRSGGNPLFAEEFVRMLTDRGFLTSEGELVDGAVITVPESLQALIAARLDTLSTDRKALLYDAAVVGKVFWPGSVAAVGGFDRGAVEQGLRELVRKELVRPARTSSVDGEPELSFWHLLVRDVAYGQIPRAARVEKHRAAAEWIEAIAAERVADHAELLAEHYRRALDLARAAQTGPTEDLERKAAHFLMLAGDRAVNLDIGKAERSYADALELVRPGTRERADLLLRHAQAAFARPGSAGVELAQQAVDAFRGLGDDRGTAGAMAHLGRVLWNVGRTAESHELLLEALALVEHQPPSAELVAVYTTLAGEAMTTGQARDSLALAEKGLRLADSLELVAPRVRLIQFVGAARCLLGDPSGLEVLRDAVRLGLEAGIGPDTALAYVNLAGFRLDAEGPEAALETYREGIDFAERRGLVGHAAWARGEQVWPLFDLGEWDAIMDLSGEYEGEGQIAVIVRTYRAYVLGLRGSLHEAAALMETLLPRAREIADAQVVVPALSAAAVIESLRRGAALPLVEDSLRETATTPAFRAWSAAEAARVCLAVGSAAARETLRRLVESIEDPGLERWVVSMASARAILAELEGRLEEAEELQLDAATRWTSFGSVYESALARLARGRCLVRLGRQAEADVDLDEARTAFSRLGALPLVADVDRHLEARAAG